MDPDESASEGCIREVREEVSLHLSLRGLVGGYKSPDRKTVYAHGNEFQFVSIKCEIPIDGKTLGLDHESTEVVYFSRSEIAQMDIMKNQLERFFEILSRQEAAFSRQSLDAAFYNGL